MAKTSHVRPYGIKVLVADPLQGTFFEHLKRHGVKYRYDPCISRDELLKEVENYDVLVVRSRTVVDKELIRRARSLKIIARAGTGTDNIDLEEARRRGIKVINAPEAQKRSVAELTLCLIMMLARSVLEGNLALRSGRWKRPLGFELMNKTLGVVGFGRIGKEVAKLTRALGMRVIVYDVVRQEREAKKIGARFAKDLDELLRRADVVSIHVPLDEMTYHMFNRETFEKMKRGVVVVNTSRGQVVDTRALLEAMDRGIVSGVGLDVFEEEPPRGALYRRLIRRRGVVAVPHLGAQTKEAQEKIAEDLAKNLMRLIG